MKPYLRSYRPLLVFLLGIGIVLNATPCYSGIFSKPIIWLAKKTGKQVVKHEARHLVISATEKEARYLTRKFGPDVLQKVDSVVAKHAIPKESVLLEMRRYGHIYKRAGFSEEAIAFGIKHGKAGRFFVNRPTLFESMKTAGCLGPGNERVIQESWNIVNRNGASWASLRSALTAAENAGTLNRPFSRDFCELLLDNRAKAGGLRDIYGKEIFPKGAELISGHTINEMTGKEMRQGIDRLLPQKNGPLRVIEFGTGRKPEGSELDWNIIRKKLTTFAETAPNRDQLRAAGYPNELLTPANLNNPNFPIHKYVVRTVVAPEIDTKLINQAEKASLGKIECFQLPGDLPH